MKNYIDFARLGKLFLMELRLHWKNYLIMMTVIFAMSALKMLTFYLGGRASNPSDVFAEADILIALIPFVLYNFVYNSTKGLAYVMLPATSFEKMLSAWIQCVAVAPVLLFSTALFCAFLGDLLGLSGRWGVNTTDFFQNYLSVISL